MAHILLAEDDSSMCRFLALALEKAGHTVVAKEDGLSALSALEEAKDDYDLLLTDIVMPGIDGIELSQRVTKACPEIKVMFITGFAAVAMGARNPQHENTKVLSKPFHLNDLVNQVNQLLAA